MKLDRLGHTLFGFLFYSISRFPCYTTLLPFNLFLIFKTAKSLYVVKVVCLYQFLAFEWLDLFYLDFYFKVIDCNNFELFHIVFIPIYSVKLNICKVNRGSM